MGDGLTVFISILFLAGGGSLFFIETRRVGDIYEDLRKGNTTMISLLPGDGNFSL